MDELVTLVRMYRYLQFPIPEWEYDQAEDHNGILTTEASAALLQKYRIISFLDVLLPEPMRIDVAFEYTSDLHQTGWEVEQMVG